MKLSREYSEEHKHLDIHTALHGNYVRLLCLSVSDHRLVAAFYFVRTHHFYPFFPVILKLGQQAKSLDWLTLFIQISPRHIVVRFEY